MVAAWATNKVLTIFVCVLALLGLIMTPVAAVQNVRLDGISLFGWHLVDGAVQARDVAYAARDKALSDLGTCNANTKGLRAAINTQNASISALGKETADAKARAAAAILAAKAGRQGAAANQRAIIAATAGADVCKSANDLIVENAK